MLLLLEEGRLPCRELAASGRELGSELRDVAYAAYHAETAGEGDS